MLFHLILPKADLFGGLPRVNIHPVPAGLVVRPIGDTEVVTRQ